MPFKLTIAGTDVSHYVKRDQLVRDTRVMNGQGSLNFALLSSCPTFPTRFDPVVYYDLADGTTPMVGGVLLTDGIKSVGQAESTLYWPMVCATLELMLTWRVATMTYTATPLKTVLTALVVYVADLGITLDAGQLTGENVNVNWTDIVVMDAIRQLATATGWVMNISATGALKMYAPGTDAAAIAFTNSDAYRYDLSWERSSQIPANYIIGHYGPAGTMETEQLWTANGSATSWVVDIPPGDDGTRGYVTVNGVVNTLSDLGGGAQYEWDSSTGTLHVGTAATPTAGWVIDLFYNGAFPFTIISDGSVSPRIVKVISDSVNYPPSATVYAAAKANNDGTLNELNQSPRTFTAVTPFSGFQVGQAVPATMTPYRVTSAELVITQIDGTLDADGKHTNVLTLVDSDIYQGSTTDQLRAVLSGGGGGGGAVSGGGGGSVTVLSSPFYMGGSQNTAVTMAAFGAGAPVPNAVPYFATASFTGRVRVSLKARTGGSGVTAYFVNLTDSTSVASSKVVSTTFNEIGFIVAVVAGKKYQVQLAIDVDGDGYCEYATLEAA